MLTTHFFEKVEIFFPKSKKENRFWTFLKCPFLKKGNTFGKLVFFLFHCKTNMSIILRYFICEYIIYGYKIRIKLFVIKTI
jgi:hypothetical protein